MKKFTYLTLSLLTFSLAVFAQKLPDMGLYKVRVNDTDRNIQAEVNPVETAPSIETDRFYYWYSGGKIKATQGGYSGKLLNGQYSEFYLNKNLKEQGQFNKGLKNKIWKSWNEQGLLLQITTWKNGLKDGKFSLYDEKGTLKQQGQYANNLLNGKLKKYYGKDSIEVIRYDHGNVFSKKKRKNTEQPPAANPADKKDNTKKTNNVKSK